MSVYLTDAARVKAALSGASFDENFNTFLTFAIPGVTAAMEREMGGRAVERVARTVLLDVQSGQTCWYLDHAPVTAVATVHHSLDRTFDADALLETDDWYVRLNDPESGLLEIPGGLAAGHDVLQVVYTGGIGTSLASIVAAHLFDDLVDAATAQVAYQWQRRDTPGGGSANTGADVSVSYEEVQLLKRVVRACRNRRLGQAWAG